MTFIFARFFYEGYQIFSIHHLCADEWIPPVNMLLAGVPWKLVKSFMGQRKRTGSLFVHNFKVLTDKLRNGFMSSCCGNLVISCLLPTVAAYELVGYLHAG